MNSFKSACSFAKSTPVSLNQLEENVEPRLGRQLGVKLVISRFGIFKTAEHLNDPFHVADFTITAPRRLEPVATADFQPALLLRLAAGSSPGTPPSGYPSPWPPAPAFRSR